MRTLDEILKIGIKEEDWTYCKADKVFIVMIHDKETRPYICGVHATREEAEESCLRLNHGFNGNGMFADFISEIVQK